MSRAGLTINSPRGSGISSLLLLCFIILMTLNDDSLVTSAPLKNANNTKNLAVLNMKTLVSIARKFTCKPRERAYHLTDLMRGQILFNNKTVQSNNEYTVPPYIVLYRCDSHAGCCDALDQICSPKTTDFEYMNITISGADSSETTSRLIRVERHRTCACKSVETAQKRSLLDAQKPEVKFVNEAFEVVDLNL